ncbi:MAG TPA: Dabb family protein [Pirellulaceae bacterium]
MLRSVLQTVGVAGGFMLMGSLLAAAAFTRQSAAVAQEQAPGGALRHVVLFKFKPEATKEQIDEIVAGFQQLPKKIEGITAFEWGTNNSPEGLNEGFTHCFVVSFNDAKSRDAYLPHQAHQDFVAILLPRLEKVLVVDYFAQK